MRFTRVASRMRSWVGASWSNFVTAVLIGLAAAVSAAAGWDQHHHVQWLVAAAVIATLGGLAQLSRQPPPVISPDATVRLGAWLTEDRKGTNFAIFSEHAKGVDLCLIDDSGRERRVALSEHGSVTGIWHVYVRGVGAGQRYGYRVSGDYDPVSGDRFNPAKLLLDPYARAIDGRVDWAGPVFGYASRDEDNEDILPDERDSGPYVPRSVVVDDVFDWGDDRHPDVPWADTVIYDVHVRGFTKLHPDVPEFQRGTFAALGSPPVISYLKDLGVTTLQLMSVHHFVSEHAVIKRGLTNYWGYNPIGYFAPEASYSSSGACGQQVAEFKAMVRKLHAAELEVILDVVFSHTAEGDHRGPHLCFRGIDNRVYYRLKRDQRRYRDYSKCGNSLNLREPHVLALIMDSLRYWVQEMHVDGFRFDLSSALARNLYEVGRLGTFFDLIRNDPVLSRVKLIAESWDVGEGGYRVDAFPAGWAEFNDRYRDAVRQFWRGMPPRRRWWQVGLGTGKNADRSSWRAGALTLEELAQRLTGSVDLCGSDGRLPFASINFVACHDGFTLHDLVSYNCKHNEANGEDNCDGVKDNDSWNCGVEGWTDNPAVQGLRDLQKRNFMTTLFLSAGVPMLLAGDELGRTQCGNNNPYCQDNEVTWVDWRRDGRSEALLQFTRRLIALRAAHPVFRRCKPFQGQAIRYAGMKDISWFTPDGTEIMARARWRNRRWRKRGLYALGLFLNGQAVFDRATQSERIPDDSFLVLLNRSSQTVSFTLPGPPWATTYELIIDTSNVSSGGNSTTATSAWKARSIIRLNARTIVVLCAK